jgi:hypothetical protein
LKIFESFTFELKFLFENCEKHLQQPIIPNIVFGPKPLAARLDFSLEIPDDGPLWPSSDQSVPSLSPSLHSSHRHYQSQFCHAPLAVKLLSSTESITRTTTASSPLIKSVPKHLCSLSIFKLNQHH